MATHGRPVLERAVVHGLGLDMDAAVRRLAQVEALPARLSVEETGAGHTFVRDTNKASYWSTLSLSDDLENWGPDVTRGARLGGA